MKKNEKGFTLIELLVVVAIIGILAAVGVVAYSGYTAGAKKSATKSNQASVVKYAASELKKCEIDATTVMGGNLTCKGRKTAAVGTAVINALKTEFNNPYDTKKTALTAATGTKSGKCGDADEGFTYVYYSNPTLTITTCAVSGDDFISNTVTVE